MPRLLVPIFAIVALLAVNTYAHHHAPPSVPDGLAAASGHAGQDDAPSGLGCGSGHLDVAPVAVEAPLVADVVHRDVKPVTIADNVCAPGGWSRCATTARPVDLPTTNLTRT